MKPQEKTHRLPIEHRSLRRMWLVGLLCLLLLPLPAAAKSLAEYRQNIGEIKKDIAALLEANHDDEDLAAAIESFGQKTAEKIERLVPVSEKVEWRGVFVDTDNRWLINRFREFQKERPNSPKRIAILSEIYERLAAIEQRITELEQVAASGRSKDEDKQKLAEILRRPEYHKPEEPEETAADGLLARLLDWLLSVLPRRAAPAGEPVGFQSFSRVLQIVLLSVVLGLIGFLIYRFVPFFAPKFRRRKEEKRERVILGEKLAPDETSENLFSQAERLAREGNLRGAIRQGYIALLCELSDRKIIGLARHKTNRDYLGDVRRRPQLYENMSHLTNSFERHWYGLDDASEEDWKEFRQGYRQAVSSEQ